MALNRRSKCRHDRDETACVICELELVQRARDRIAALRQGNEASCDAVLRHMRGLALSHARAVREASEVGQ